MQKIYRLEEGKKIAGICAGIADMYSLDVTIVRLVSIFFAVLTTIWPAIITYLAGWYLIPVKKRPLDRKKVVERNSFFFLISCLLIAYFIT